LALLAGTGVALFEWISQTLGNVRRLEAQHASALLTRNALALARGVNPLEQPAGSLSAGRITVTWQSRPDKPLLPGQTAVPGMPGVWQVGLFRMEVQARDERSGLTTRFELAQLGMRRQGEASPALPRR
jgi:general secretion pathway protein I